MTAKMLERVLNCPALPTLPGVAISMLELLRQPTCTAERVAELIQNDPALASKVLKTVNSSYYGLTKPCPTISRAVSLLGMNTVKSLMLGLSLVDSGRDTGFDLPGYWRRSVYSAAAARIIAKLSGRCDPDEVFIAAILQDVGMLACYAALGTPYAVLMTSAPDHESLAPREQDQLGFDHAEAGAQIAEKWRLPDHIIACTRFHHRAETAPAAHEAIVRVVAASAEAAAALVAAEPQTKVAGFRKRMREWFNTDAAAADELLHEITASAKELSKLLELDTGEPPDVAGILAEAGEQLLHHQVDMERRETELTKQTITDAMTGASNRKHFDATMERLFREAVASGKPLSVLFADADKFKSVNDTLGHQAGDVVLIEIARRLRAGVGSAGTVCRYGGEEFAVALPGVDLEAAMMLADKLRKALEAKPIEIAPLKLSSSEVKQTISIGVSCLSSPVKYPGWEALVHAADEAVYAAKKAGRNRVMVARDVPTGAPKRRASDGAPPATDEGVVILIVEDDALAAKMLEVMLARGKFRAVVSRSAEEALRVLQGGTPLRPSLVVVDQNLPAMSGAEFVRACRGIPALKDLRFVMMSSCGDEGHRKKAMDAGALAFLEKGELCADVAGSLKRLGELARKAA